MLRVVNGHQHLGMIYQSEESGMTGLVWSTECTVGETMDFVAKDSGDRIMGVELIYYGGILNIKIAHPKDVTMWAGRKGTTRIASGRQYINKKGFPRFEVDSWEEVEKVVPATELSSEPVTSGKSAAAGK